MRASGFAVSNVCVILQRTAERGCPLIAFNSGIDWRSSPRFDSCGIIVGAVWELDTILVALFVAGVAGLLRGVTGFGSSLVLAPVLSIILGPIEAVAITLLIGISASIFLIPRYLADYDRDTVLPLSFADSGGLGSIQVAKMAVEDFGGKILGKPIQTIHADHLNKPDNAVNIAAMDRR